MCLCSFTVICCLVLTSVLCPIFGSCWYVWYVTILSFISVLSFTTAECIPTMHRWPWFMLHFLSCLYECREDFQSLKQLLCVNQPLFFFLSRVFSAYCTVLYLSEHSVWPVGRVGIFFLLLIHIGVIQWVLCVYWVLKFQHRIFHCQSVLQTSSGLRIW